MLDTQRRRWMEERPLASVPMGDLLSRFLRDARLLARKEIELARAELQELVKKQVAMMVGFAAAGAFLFIGAGVLVAGLVLALAQAMPGWAAALVVGAAALVIGVAFLVAARSNRVRRPFERTRRTLKENAQWLRRRMA